MGSETQFQVGGSCTHVPCARLPLGAWAWAWLCLQSHLGTYLSWCPVTALGPCFIRSVEEESKVRGARREQPHLGAGRAHTRGPPGWAGFLGGGQSGPDMAFREQ